ncbi:MULTISPECIES: PA4780 family RIO1-like protein kinase [Marinomonas]|uniref:non-specific serine/threonine protein kinase n=1 Tax=Marinomonas alcarazii TaxID=491949 RepID=A0A318UYE1_9GAMM|nr:MULTISPECIES: PA4780 family RIO1-like protein kinase [Marinomonas]PYF80571.1 RIO kinase 1 [Marinomonas alcarazii]
MKIPKRIQPLIEDGLVDEVLRQLMSGKEATVYVVRCGSEIRCAKVYKEAGKRSFKQAVQYREGRKVRNSRRSRAMEKGSKFGRDEQESLWQNAEVDALYRLAAAGVRAPTPYGCFDGVLLMELVTDDSGDVAPRLNDVVLTPEQARRDHDAIIKDIVRMLSAGIIHGDLSEFNVLVDSHGPVIIDLPQAVDAVANNNAEWMLERDVNNMRNYYGMFAPELLETKYAKEMWALFEAGKLTAHTELTGHFEEPTEEADVDSVLQEIQDAFEEEQDRLARINSANDDD